MRYNYTGILLLFACVLALSTSDSGSSPIVVWSQRSHIWSKLRGIRDDFDKWVANGSDPTDTVHSKIVPNGAIYSLGYDPVKDDLYWNDKAKHSIYRQPRTASFKAGDNGDGVKTLFAAGAESEIDGIAVDWMTKMVYFTDYKKRWIGVVASGKHAANMYRILFHTDLGDPKGITLDPYEGLLFWVDPVKGRIERSTLAGEERQQLVTSTSPRGITADLQEKRLYWVDRDKGTIESSSYDGNDQKVHFSGGRGRTYLGITTFKDYIFVATDMSLTLDVHDKKSGLRLRKWDIDAAIYDVIIVASNQSPVRHDCDDKECEQLCLNTGHGKGVCGCVEGYYLDTDGKSCIESKPRYIYSVGDAILSADVTIDDRIPRLTNERRVIDKMNTVQALGFHYERHLLYFSDTVRDVIYRGDPDVGKWTEHTVGTRQVEGISVDWLSGNVYWTDATLGHVMVSRLDGRYHRILVSSAGQPRGVSADPTNRWLFWSERTKGEIRRSRLDGSDATTLITGNLTSPQGLVVDPRMKRLYWVNRDATKLEYTNIDGEHRAVAIKATGSSIYDVTVFQEFATWTEGKKGIRVGLGTTGEAMTNTVFTNSSVTQSYDVVTYDRYLQPRTTNVCGDDTDCEQLCFPSATGHTCGCAIGFTLNKDGKSCDSEVTDRFFALFPDPYHKQVYQLRMSAATGSPSGVKLPLMDYPVSVDYDPALALFYWLDRGAGQVKRSSAHGTHELVLLQVTQDMYPERISLDPVSKFLYYTDSKKGAIFRISLAGDKAGDPEIVVSKISHPFAIFVDYNASLLYWSSLEPKGKIEVSNLNGTERRVVVNDTKTPTGIAVSHGGDMLYYGDRQLRRVMALNMTTGKSSMLFNGTDEEIYALAATDIYVYFTAWNKKAVYRIDISKDNNVKMVSDPIFARLTDIRVFEERLPLTQVQPPHGLDIIVIIGLILALLLLLLLLLLGFLLAARRCRRSSKQLEDGNDTATTSANSDTIDGPSDDWTGLDTINHDMFEPLPASPSPTVPSETSPENAYANGSAPSGGAVPPPADVTTPDVPVPASLAPLFAAAAGAEGNPDTSDATSGGSGDKAGSPEVPSGGSGGKTDSPEAPVCDTDTIAVPLPMPLPIIIGGESPKESATPNESSTDGAAADSAPDPKLNDNFELPEDVRVATVIQRIVSRLRGGLASIRWNNSERPRIATKADGDSDHHIGGRTAKDMAKRRRASLFPPEPAYTPPDPSTAKKPPQKAKNNGHYPSALHRQPRGFAPASHYVPRTFKMSWGRNTRKAPE